MKSSQMLFDEADFLNSSSCQKFDMFFAVRFSESISKYYPDTHLV